MCVAHVLLADSTVWMLERSDCRDILYPILNLSVCEDDREFGTMRIVSVGRKLVALRYVANSE
jgi:hypothetical protein